MDETPFCCFCSYSVVRRTRLMWTTRFFCLVQMYWKGVYSGVNAKNLARLT